MTIIASFDVFDTALIRSVTNPRNLFLRLGQKLSNLGLEVSPVAFQTCRIEAERRSRENSNDEEISLEDIYDELTYQLGWDSTLCAKGKQLELELESESLSSNPKIMEIIASARALGHKVIFVSDMYLPSLFIENELRRFGLFVEGDICFVSSEWKITKASGKLFKYILKKFQIAPESLIHIGDNAYSDYLIPRRIGIRARLYNDCRPNRYEGSMDALSISTDGVSSSFAGAARLARLTCAEASRRNQILWEAGACVAAPILTAYVIWLLEQARSSGIKKLYFLARDGYLLYQIAKHLTAKHDSSIEMRYLYASRQAWHLPSIHQLSDKHLDWILEPTNRMSLRKVLARVEILPEEFAKELLDSGFPSSSYDVALDDTQKQLLSKLLLTQPFSDLISSRAHSRRVILLKYLKQEGLTEGQKWAIVDIGWKGRLQKSLKSILKDGNRHPLVGYYFALFSRPEEADELNTFFFDTKLRKGLRNACLTATMMEMFCTATDGTTTGYVERDGVIYPEFTGSGKSLREWGIEIVHKAVIEFAKSLASQRHPDRLCANLRPMVGDLVNLWWMYPELEHASVWGSFPFEDDQVGGDSHPVAVPFTWIQCLSACKRRGKWFQRFQTEWQPASIVLTHKSKRILVRLVRCVFLAIDKMNMRTRVILSLIKRSLLARKRKIWPKS